jgi:ABC-type sulfate transport system permease component
MESHCSQDLELHKSQTNVVTCTLVATDMDTEVMLSCSEKPLVASWLLEIPRTIGNYGKILHFVITSIETKTLVILKYRIKLEMMLHFVLGYVFDKYR